MLATATAADQGRFPCGRHSNNVGCWPDAVGAREAIALRTFIRVLSFALALALVGAVVAIPTAAATRTLTFAPDADATIQASHPNRSYGTSSTLTVDNSPVQNTLLRATVSGVGSDVVMGATLRVFVTNGSPVAGTVYRVASQTWTESVTWATAPTASTAITTAGKAKSKTWVSFDLTSLIQGDGTYSVRIASPSSDGASYASREATAAQRPQLVVTTAAPDTTRPTVAVSAPADGTTVSGQVPIDASASDNVGVSSVSFLVDDVGVGTDPTEPYEVSWDTTLLVNGSHTVSATAVDAAGNVGTATSVTVSVANTTDEDPPTSPGNLTATATGPTTVTLAWDASTDDTSVASYEVKRDAVVIASVTSPGYLDAAAPSGSSLSYSVVAIDPSGNRSVAATAQVTTPSIPTSFSFAAAGDIGANSATAATLAKLDTSSNAFFLATGDMRYADVASDQAWCDFIHAHLPQKGASYPFELVSGNHEEDGSADGSILTQAACLPDHLGVTPEPGSQYGAEYYVDYPPSAPLARIIMISPGLTIAGEKYSFSTSSPHYAWLASAIDAAHAAGISWVIVGMHYPCLSAGVYGCTAGTPLMNLLLQKHVDLVMHAHDHSYQRSKQLALDPSTCPSLSGTGYAPGCVSDDGLDGVYPKGTGTVDVINGTFGRDLFALSRRDPEAPYFVKLDGTTHGYLQYTVTANELDATFVKSDGSFTDSFAIVDGATPSTDRTPPSAPGNLAADTSVPGRVTLSWSPSTDDVAISDYAVLRDGTYVGSTASTTFVDPSVSSGSTYTYSVIANDTAFNPSSPATVSTTIPMSSTLTFAPVADASVLAASPTTNYGSATTIATDNSPIKNFLIRITVTGVGTSTVTSANLRLTCTDQSTRGGDFTLAASNDWTESSVNWNTAPAAGTIFTSLGSVAAGTTYNVDLSSIIHGDGTYTIRVTTSSSDGADYASKEAAIGTRPQLVITTA
jgi:hypothetical protein